jgi:hypothetical protein
MSSIQMMTQNPECTTRAVSSKIPNDTRNKSSTPTYLHIFCQCPIGIGRGICRFNFLCSSCFLGSATTHCHICGAEFESIERYTIYWPLFAVCPARHLCRTKGQTNEKTLARPHNCRYSCMNTLVAELKALAQPEILQDSFGKSWSKNDNCRKKFARKTKKIPEKEEDSYRKQFS